MTTYNNFQWFWLILMFFEAHRDSVPVAELFILPKMPTEDQCGISYDIKKGKRGTKIWKVSTILTLGTLR